MASSDGTAAAAALKARGYAGILISESAGVMAVMRQNAKWALVPGYGYGDENGPDDPMLEEFRAMRRALFTWRDWDKVAPVAYLAPFLRVIRSVETSGPITGCVILRFIPDSRRSPARRFASDAASKFPPRS
jgi:brefeldin A-resistance guanine nucleotide exchange factor 1